MDQLTLVRQTLERWTGALTWIDLRAERRQDHPAQLDVRVGARGYQRIQLNLEPGRSFGERTTSQSVERFVEGRVRFTTPWDDHWTDTTPQGGIGYHDWVNASLGAVVLGHLRWGAEGTYTVKTGDRALLQLVRELLQVQAPEPDLIQTDESLSAVLTLAEPLLRAVEGDVRAVHALAEVAVASRGGLDDLGSPLALLAGPGAACLKERSQPKFAQQIAPRLEAETRRIAWESQTNPKAFRRLRRVVDCAPSVVGHSINAWLQEVAAEQTPESADARDLMARIERYQALSQAWRGCRPSAEDPAVEVEAFVRLEAEIDGAWRQTLDAESGLTRSELEARLTLDGRFLSGGSGLVFAWMRMQQQFDAVVSLFCEQMRDVELVKLRHRSQTQAFEYMVNNGLGAFLDSGNEEHIDLAIECVDALEATIDWETGRAEYQLACVFSRAGQLERALEAVERAVENGHSIHAMQADTDPVAVVLHPAFQRLLKAV